MFTQYYVRGSFTIKGNGGFFFKRPLSEKIQYQRSFVVDTGADIRKVATIDMEKRINQLVKRLNEKIAESKFPVSVSYGVDGALSRVGNDFKLETYFYREPVRIGFVSVIEILNEQSIADMGVDRARSLLTVAQWKRLMSK